MATEDQYPSFQERNAAICAYYQAGHPLDECALRFSLGRQRIRQILEQAGVWRPTERGVRTKFLGVNVSPSLKDRLTQRAKKAKKSVSRLASDILEETVPGDEQ